ncbi:hypothetical protein P691DRAFT_763437 [Macrolepiota fuliginosa MF-IS2]|uniref:Uncharacterized protein n=1 Tax=Macrolepiota fuliginosa MF-IS2 TaxID=1400762 RepID=A0A9P5X749_9AGAR|nr:hypothetical protein P691DRAFT_763437 [Macrolepiota fuliginosa MF-IS2]
MLGLVLETPLAFPGERVKKEDIGRTVTQEDYMTFSNSTNRANSCFEEEGSGIVDTDKVKKAEEEKTAENKLAKKKNKARKEAGREKSAKADDLKAFKS